MAVENFGSLLAHQKSVGANLAAARLSRGMSIQDVAETSKVSSRFLTALEEDDFSVFLGRVYVLGFAKAYARVVGLDVDQVLTNLRQQLD